MMNLADSHACPLCRSPLDEARYLEAASLWDEKLRLEAGLRDDIAALAREKERLLAQLKGNKSEMKKALREAVEKGKRKEKSRADMLSKMIQGKASEIQSLNHKVKELQEQLKHGTTPQVEGLNLEVELMKELKSQFEGDKVERFGKAGDILQSVVFNDAAIGSILYECKKTSRFYSAYVDQVREAMARRQCTYGVLVTAAFKKGTAGFWVEKDILVVHPYGAVYIAMVLRNLIMEIHTLRSSGGDLEARSQAIMEFIRGEEFKTYIDDSIYRTRMLYDMLLKEIKQHQGVWEDRYNHYKFLFENIGRLQAATANILKGLSPVPALDGDSARQLPPPFAAG